MALVAVVVVCFRCTYTATHGTKKKGTRTEGRSARACPRRRAAPLCTKQHTAPRSSRVCFWFVKRVRLESYHAHVFSLSLSLSFAGHIHTYTHTLCIGHVTRTHRAEVGKGNPNVDLVKHASFPPRYHQDAILALAMSLREG